MKILKNKVEKLLLKAGVKINGSNPWDIQVNDESFFKEVAFRGSLGFGESYMRKLWDSKELDVLFCRMLEAGLQKESKPSFLGKIANSLFNHQTRKRALKSVSSHYDKGNDFYRKMLGNTMVYSCAYWPEADDLNQAQLNKLDLICRKIGLKQGQMILDVGCGWGSFARYAAEQYGAFVIGITLSKEQVVFAKELCKDFSVEILQKDYRDIEGKFDHIVSVGMFEHVGLKNYKEYFFHMNRLLKDFDEDGISHFFLLHTIGGNTSSLQTNEWIDKYIFPDSLIPSMKQISSTIEGNFIIEDLHNFGADYDKTLMAWKENFEKNYKEFSETVFHRMWRYYLASCAGAFRARYIQLWQMVLSKTGVPGGYTSVR